MMHWIDTYVQPLAAWIAQHPLLGTLAVFVLALSESLPAIGALVPGTAIILAVAGLAGLGYLPLIDVLVAACLGAIAGDAIAYLFGHHYREHALKIWPLSRFPQMVAASDVFFRKYGGASILVARFTPGVRAFVPMIAGVSGMPMIRFFVANATSAIVWAASHVGPAAAAGASLAALHQVSGRLVAVLAAVIVLAIILTWFMRRGLTWGSQWLTVVQQRAHAALLGRNGRVAAVLRDLTHPAGGAAREVAFLGAILALSGVALFNLIEDVLERGGLMRADRAVSTLVGGWRTAWGDSIMIVITSLGDTPVTALVAILAAVWIYCHGERRLALGIIAALAATALFVIGMKATMHIPRPTALYSGADAFSFPSGHATFAAALYGVLGWILSRDLPSPWRTALVAGLSTLVAAIAVSRIYLQAHWPSDVAAGLIFGFALSSAFAIAFRQVQLAPIKPRQLLLAACATFLAVGAAHAATSHSKGLAMYATQSKVQTVSTAEWLQGGWRSLPVRRIDLAGEREQPVILQWGGSIGELAQLLKQRGWTESVPLSLATAGRYLSASTSATALPVLPKLNDGRSPALIMIKASSQPDRRSVLFVWPSSTVLTDQGTQPVLVGVVIDETLRHPVPMTTIVSRVPTPGTRAAEDFARSLPHALRVDGAAGLLVLAHP